MTTNNRSIGVLSSSEKMNLKEIEEIKTWGVRCKMNCILVPVNPVVNTFINVKELHVHITTLSTFQC